MSAFRSLLEGTTPSGSSSLDKSGVMSYSAQLYDIDASISLERAKTYASIITSLNETQRAYLDKMASGGMLTWPVVDVSELLKNSGQGNSVAMRTYASEMFAWYAGSVDADVYFCPERQATYFGSFYMKDRPAMGNPNYSISTTLTGDSGEAFLALLTDSQREKITSLVETQRSDLNEIVAKRQAIATELRSALNGETIDESLVRSLSARYGELDGEISYYYATQFAEVGKTLTSEQKQKMIELRNLDGFVCDGAYLYSQPITMPQNIPASFLFGLGTYSADEMSAWILSQQVITPTIAPTTLPTTVPTTVPTTEPTVIPTTEPTIQPTFTPPNQPTVTPREPGPGKIPAVKSINPTSGVIGTTVQFTISGQNFGKEAEVSLQRNGVIISAGTVSVQGSDKIKGSINIPSTADIGQWTVIVKQGSSLSNMDVQFEIRSGSGPQPTQKPGPQPSQKPGPQPSQRP